MIEAIVYNSHQGFSKQYAYSLAVATKLPIYSLSESRKLDEGTHIIYFSWVKNGKIVDLDRVKKKFIIDYVCPVGLYPFSEEMVEKLKEENKIETLFYLRGGLRYYKLNMIERTIFNDIKKDLEKKSKKQRLSIDENDMLFITTNGYEKIDLSALEPLIEWILDERENVVS